MYFVRISIFFPFWMSFGLTIESKTDKANYISQASCLFITVTSSSSIFLTQSVTILGQLVPLESFHRQAVSFLFSSIFIYSRFSTWKSEKEWLTAFAVYHFSVSNSFDGCLSFYGFFLIWKKFFAMLDTNFSPFFHLNFNSHVDSIITFIPTILSKCCFWNAFAQSKQKSYLWKFQYPNYKA